MLRSRNVSTHDSDMRRARSCSGTIPIVRKTGGLNDTVFDVDGDQDRAASVGVEPNGCASFLIHRQAHIKPSTTTHTVPLEASAH